ncbi:MAG TPA: hypothetical protein VG871_20145 [Vicinamibacterales bacterium]|nr:hypothetical protein [Vicinamibacterales bacterium]
MLEVSQCAVCGQNFTWSHAESSTPPTCCPDHRGVAATSATAASLSRRLPTSTSLANFPNLQQLLAGDDLKQLLAEASRPIEHRSRTFLEWFNDVDIINQQVQEKFAAGDTLQSFMEQRLTLFDTLAKAARRVEDFQHERLEAELKTLTLEDEINEELALRSIRVATKVARAVAEYQKALQPDRSGEVRQESAPAPKRQKPAKTERERVLDDVRRDRKARVHAADDMMRDFLREIDIAAGCRASIHERALRIRVLMDVFEQDEESLPGSARWILHVAERERDAS